MLRASALPSFQPTCRIGSSLTADRQSRESTLNKSTGQQVNASTGQLDKSSTNYGSLWIVWIKSMNQGWTYHNQIDQASAGLSLLDYYSQRYPHSSRDEWQQRILAGQIWLNGAPALPQTLLQVGQQLAYHRPPWQEPDVPLDFSVQFADQDLLIVAKPAGLPVLPGGGFLEHTLLTQLQRQYPAETPFPIHRLGRGTSGLMLLARSTAARAELSRQMRQRQIRKVYRALVSTGANTAGIANLPDQFTITQPIGKLPHPVLGYVYGAISSNLAAAGQIAQSQIAQSECRVLQRRTDTALLEVTILTGRPHQIRIHLAAYGYPLWGDPLYARGGIPIGLEDCTVIERTFAESFPPEHPTPAKLPVPGDCGYHLHAYSLAFQHPCTEQPLHLVCPAPPLLECLECI
jgi:23S rRNA pseudouridine1911/1915/1917 synthase